MRALLQEAALAEDADLRRGPDRRQPVRDHQRRARRRGHELVERGLDDLLGFRIERGRRLIQYEQSWRPHNRASNGDALLLTTRELYTAAADLRVEALRQGVDELQRVRERRGVAHVLERGVGLAVFDVVRYRARKERRLLTHESDR